MTTLLVILWVVSMAVTVLVAAMRPTRSDRSLFELKRLHDDDTLRKERLAGDADAILRLGTWLGIMSASMLAVAAWGGWGVVAMLTGLLAVSSLTRVRAVRRLAGQGYVAAEPRLLAIIEQYPRLARLVRADTPKRRDPKLESPEHLLHLVESASYVLSDDQRTIITHGLAWHTTTVGDIMTGRKDIASVKHDELLGPLVLDDLHKTGHNRFPVMKGSIDDIIGVLDITESLEVTGGRASRTVEQAMSPRVLRIETDEPLPVALAMLQKSHLHLLIVVDADGKTAGLLTLADITGSLLGKTGVK